MKRVGQARTFEEQIQYHLDDGRAPWFIDTQRGRTELARFLLDKCIREFTGYPRLTIVELGCGAADITGPQSQDHKVIGFDLTDEAKRSVAERWPGMTFHQTPVEQVEPFECDILVMTEFLEHVDNPVSIVQSWLPKAKWSIIGHPLNEPDPPIEPGHVWSYTREDWRRWFTLGGHRWWEEFRFPMGGWDEMIIGHGQRQLKPQ